jgi:hypothetical protein
MKSDSSDDDGDLFENIFMDEDVFPPEVPNVGLEVENFKFTRGEKGRLVTTHCNPRTLSKKPYDTLSKKLNKVDNELNEYVAEFNAIQDSNRLTADGILMGLISNNGMTKREAKAVFHIGSSRWARTKQSETAKKGHGLNGQQMLTEDLQHLSDFLTTLEVELGYPCQHRKMKRYSTAYDTYKDLWQGYCAFNPTGSLPRKMKHSTFQKYLKKVHPDFALHRAKEDECDTCIRLKMILNDDRATEEEKAEAQECYVKHNKDSREMRVAMQKDTKENNDTDD